MMSNVHRNTIKLDQPATYLIEVQGALDPSWSEALGELQIEHRLGVEGGAITRLTGKVADQAALAGVLNLTFMLGMPLLAVTCLSTSEHP